MFRHFDALVAEKLMGWKRYRHVSSFSDQKGCLIDPAYTNRINSRLYVEDDKVQLLEIAIDGGDFPRYSSQYERLIEAISKYQQLYDLDDIRVELRNKIVTVQIDCIGRDLQQVHISDQNKDIGVSILVALLVGHGVSTEEVNRCLNLQFGRNDVAADPFPGHPTRDIL